MVKTAKNLLWLGIFLSAGVAISTLWANPIIPSVSEKKSLQPNLTGFDFLNSDYSEFVSSISSRQVFSFASSRQNQSSSADANQELKQIKDNLKLIGIIAGSPSQAIIEYKNGEQTFYLKPKDVFLDTVTVEKINKNSVEFLWHDQKFEVNL